MSAIKKVDVLHVRLTDLHAPHQNLPFPRNRTLPLKQYQYQGRLVGIMWAFSNGRRLADNRSSASVLAILCPRFLTILCRIE